MASSAICLSLANSRTFMSTKPLFVYSQSSYETTFEMPHQTYAHTIANVLAQALIANVWRHKQDSRIKRIDMSESQPDIVNGLVQYLYTGDYANGKAKEASDSKFDEDVLAELLSHIQFHHMAFRYKI